jgi:hypothetical protein
VNVGRQVLVVVGALMTGATQLPAQQTAPPDTVALRAARATLRSDLRNLVVAQERYFADHSTYAPSMRELGAIYIPSRGVTVMLLTSGARGHSEVAIIDRAPGLVCGMFVGSGPGPLGEGNEGEVVCRDP